jgi:putative ABC transport system permease protein
MEWIRRLTRRAWMLFHHRHVESLMDAEMRDHVEREVVERIRNGAAPDEARRTALRDFGGLERFKEEGRDARGGRLTEDFLQDARYAVRVLRRNPGFTAATVLTFALGVGLTTTIFTVVHGVLLRPLPYASPDQLVVLWERDIPHARDQNVVSVGNFEAWRAESHSFSSLVGMVPAPVTLTGGAEPERARGANVSPAYFDLLGVRPAIGRAFNERDELGEGANVVILSDGLWKRRFAGDSSAVGRTMDIGGQPYTVVGVMPPDFEAPRFFWLGNQELWLPFAPTAANRSWGRFLIVIARLRHDVSMEQARAEMTTIAARRAREVKDDEGWSVSLMGLAEQITGDVRRPLLVLLGAVVLLMLMAVTNVAGLALGLARRRQHELEVRRAIGASSRRLLRQLFTQSAILGLIGGAVGIAVALLGVRGVLSLLPSDIPRAGSIRVDPAVLLFTTVSVLVGTVLFGIAAAVRGTGSARAAPLTLSTHRATARLQGGSLVTMEIAFGVVLAVLAVLMARSFVALRSVDLGFEPRDVVIARVSLFGKRYETPEAQRAFFDALLDRVRTERGVRAAGIVSTRPFGGEGPATPAADAARPAATARDAPVADIRYTDAGFFRALRMRFLDGHEFDAREAPLGPPRAIISKSLARALWPSESPVGHRVALDIYNGIQAEVVGEVDDAHLIDARTAARPAVYLAVARFPTPVADVVMRYDGDAAIAVAALRRDVAAIDPSLPVHGVTTMAGLAADALARDRFTAALLGAFAVVSVLLAAVGIYGVFSGDVSRRRKEMGIRLALGARYHGVIGLVLRRALARTLAGIAIGLVAALVLARALTTLLFGIGAADPVAYVGVSALLAGVAVLATLVPALSAARVSPLEVIRAD